MAKFTKHYEEVIEDMLDRELIDPEKVTDQQSFWTELKKFDTDNKISIQLFEELIETQAYGRLINNNLTVVQTPRKDIVSDGEKFEIPRTKKVSYMKGGRKVVYYTRGRVAWGNNEVSWLRENRTLPTKLLLYRYYQKFGTRRTVSSITSKRYSMGKQRGSGGTMSASKKKPKTRYQKKRDILTEADVVESK